MSVVPVADGLKLRTIVSLKEVELNKQPVVSVLPEGVAYKTPEVKTPSRIAPVLDLKDKPVYRNIDMQMHAQYANRVVALAAAGSDLSAIIKIIDSHLRNVDTRLQTSIREIYKNSGALKLITGQKQLNPSVPKILTVLGISFELQFLSKEEDFTTSTASKSRRHADYMEPARALGARGVRRPTTGKDLLEGNAPEDLSRTDSEDEGSYGSESEDGVDNTASSSPQKGAQAYTSIIPQDEAARLDEIIARSNRAFRLRDQVAQAREEEARNYVGRNAAFYSGAQVATTPANSEAKVAAFLSKDPYSTLTLASVPSNKST